MHHGFIYKSTGGENNPNYQSFMLEFVLPPTVNVKQTPDACKNSLFFHCMNSNLCNDIYQ